MEIIYINREIVKIAESLGLTTIDDAEFLKANVLWIESINKISSAGNKSNNDRKVFYLNLNLYELDSNKAKLYELGEKFSEAMLNEFFKDENYGYKISIKKRSEELRKVAADTGKLYQYSFSFVVTTYKINC